MPWISSFSIFILRWWLFSKNRPIRAFFSIRIWESTTFYPRYSKFRMMYVWMLTLIDKKSDNINILTIFCSSWWERIYKKLIHLVFTFSICMDSLCMYDCTTAFILNITILEIETLKWFGQVIGACLLE